MNHLQIPRLPSVELVMNIFSWLEREEEKEREREMDGNFLMEIKQVLNVTDSLGNYKTCALINPSMCYNYKNSCLVSKAFLTCMVSY